ncbi:hypothetical protein [Thalassospira lohafexi]|uniref:Uncharacterized protein n=1 Tax=Thalassospira lohafexi TaxID=744227 RepID=A0A2N3L0J1_9PROT|nr:hypothetical protein [Thalassospira lohafexi]PKR56335.1 hypothetical protein COO92_21255 [Thalassospira lohafexi]
MGWNGSGVVTRNNGTNSGSNTWENDRDASIKITADNHDTHDQDLADAIQNTIAKDGQNTPTADLPMNNQKHTGVGNATAANHYAGAGQVQNGAFQWGGTAAGTADALTINLTPTLTAYTAGLTVRFLASDDSATTTPTININAAGAKTLVNQDGDALTAGDIVNGTIYEATYDGTNFRVYVSASQDLSDYVQGPASATDGAVALFDGTGGKTLKDGPSITSGSGDLLRADGDGSGLSGIVDQIARDIAATSLAWQLAQADAASVPGADLGNLKLVDNLQTDSLATKTGATYDSVNDWYSNATTTDDGTAGETGIDTAELSNATGANAGMQFSAAASGSVVEATFDVLSVATPGNYHVEIWSNSGNSPSAQIGSDSASVNITTSGVKTFTWATGPSVTASTVYWVVLVPEGAYNITASTCATVAGFISCRDNTITSLATGSPINASRDLIFGMTIATSAGTATLVPTATTITTGAQDALGYFIYDPVDATTLGTDLTVDISIDGGSTYEAASLTAVGDLGSTGKKLFRAEADVSGQSGTSLQYRLKLDAAAAAKEMRYTDCVGLIPLY